MSVHVVCVSVCRVSQQCSERILQEYKNMNVLLRLIVSAFLWLTILNSALDTHLCPFLPNFIGPQLFFPSTSD